MSEELENELENELEMAMNDLLLLGARLEWSPSDAESVEIQAEIDDTKSVIAASLRARPQEPRLSKEWLDELIEKTMAASPGDSWSSDSLAGRGGMVRLRDAILSAPSGPLSDEPRESENQDGAAPVLGGEKK